MSEPLCQFCGSPVVSLIQPGVTGEPVAWCADCWERASVRAARRPRCCAVMSGCALPAGHDGAHDDRPHLAPKEKQP